MRKREMRIDDVRELLASRCRDIGGQGAFARRHKLQVQYVSQVLLGKRPPSAKMCKALGIREDGMRWVTVKP